MSARRLRRKSAAEPVFCVSVGSIVDEAGGTSADDRDLHGPRQLRVQRPKKGVNVLRAPSGLAGPDGGVDPTPDGGQRSEGPWLDLEIEVLRETLDQAEAAGREQGWAPRTVAAIAAPRLPSGWLGARDG